MAAKDTLGRVGEDFAVHYLIAAGYRILARNWRCSQGEIDVIAEQNGEVIFVEVKTRSGLAFGHPFEAITVAKLARLRRLAATWCAEAGGRFPRIRIDAIAVIAPHGRQAKLEHLERVF